MKSHKKILIYYIGYMTFKYLEYVKINSVNLLYLIIDKIKGYFEEINKDIYLTLVTNIESTEIKNKTELLRSKIREPIRLITNRPDDCNEKYMNI